MSQLKAKKILLDLQAQSYNNAQCTRITHLPTFFQHSNNDKLNGNDSSAEYYVYNSEKMLLLTPDAISKYCDFKQNSYLKPTNYFPQFMNLTNDERDIHSELNEQNKLIMQIKSESKKRRERIKELTNYLNDMPYDIKLHFVKKKPLLIKCVKNPSFELLFTALKSDGLVLRHIPIIFQTPEICMEAINQCPFAIQYIYNPTNEQKLAAVRQNGLTLQYIYAQTNEICMEAVKQNGLAIKYVFKPTYELKYVALKQNPYAIKDIENPIFEMCKFAYELNNKTIIFMPIEFIELLQNEPCNI